MPSLYVCSIVDVTGCACCSFMISDLLCVNSSLLTIPAECSVSIALPVVCKYVTVSFQLVHVTVLEHPGLGFVGFKRSNVMFTKLESFHASGELHTMHGNTNLSPLHPSLQRFIPIPPVPTIISSHHCHCRCQYTFNE